MLTAPGRWASAKYAGPSASTSAKRSALPNLATSSSRVIGIVMALLIGRLGAFRPLLPGCYSPNSGAAVRSVPSVAVEFRILGPLWVGGRGGAPVDVRRGI